MIEQSLWRMERPAGAAEIALQIDGLYNQLDVMALDRDSVEAEPDATKRSADLAALDAEEAAIKAEIAALEATESTPVKVYTLVNFGQMGSAHLAIFAKTIAASLAVSGIALVVCYPIAYAVAKLETPRTAALITLELVIPYSPPSITVWQGFTLHWFAEFWGDARMWSGLVNSLVIAVAVMALALPMGLSEALLLSRLGRRSAGIAYTVMVSPLLTPGIIIGISTVIFWRNFGTSASLFTVILAQSAFIASYAMLMFMARLQRQDHTLEEAALDLGATRARAFRRITLPFLKPTIVTAAVIAFLQSFENYNTTIFSIGCGHTLVAEIGARMRWLPQTGFPGFRKRIQHAQIVIPQAFDNESLFLRSPVRWFPLGFPGEEASR